MYRVGASPEVCRLAWPASEAPGISTCCIKCSGPTPTSQSPWNPFFTFYPLYSGESIYRLTLNEKSIWQIVWGLDNTNLPHACQPQYSKTAPLTGIIERCACHSGPQTGSLLTKATEPQINQPQTQTFHILCHVKLMHRNFLPTGQETFVLSFAREWSFIFFPATSNILWPHEFWWQQITFKILNELTVKAPLKPLVHMTWATVHILRLSYRWFVHLTA